MLNDHDFPQNTSSRLEKEDCLTKKDSKNLINSPNNLLNQTS